MPETTVVGSTGPPEGAPQPCGCCRPDGRCCGICTPGPSTTSYPDKVNAALTLTNPGLFHPFCCSDFSFADGTVWPMRLVPWYATVPPPDLTGCSVSCVYAACGAEYADSPPECLGWWTVRCDPTFPGCLGTPTACGLGVDECYHYIFYCREKYWYWKSPQGLGGVPEDCTVQWDVSPGCYPNFAPATPPPEPPPGIPVRPEYYWGGSMMGVCLYLWCTDGYECGDEPLEPVTAPRGFNLGLYFYSLFAEPIDNGFSAFVRSGPCIKVGQSGVCRKRVARLPLTDPVVYDEQSITTPGPECADGVFVSQRFDFDFTAAGGPAGHVDITPAA